MRKRKRSAAAYTDQVLDADMPYLVSRLPRNWDTFMRYLHQRRYSSGDVHSCIGVSRKVLKDWDRAGILTQLYQGLGSGQGNERFGKWRLFSIFDIWNLALYKRLRDEGVHIERLRVLKQNPDSQGVFEEGVIRWWFYQALPSWLSRQPFWVYSNMQLGVWHTPIERINRAIYLTRIRHVEQSTADLILTLNLIPLMDKVMTLSGPLEMRLHKTKGLMVQIEGQELHLEALPKPDQT